MPLTFCSSVLKLGFNTLWNNRERYNDITLVRNLDNFVILWVVGNNAHVWWYMRPPGLAIYAQGVGLLFVTQDGFVQNLV